MFDGVDPLPAADGGEDGDFVVGVQHGGIAVGGLVAVDPDAGVAEDGGEVGAVRGAGGVEELTEGGGVEVVTGAAGGFPGLGEQAQPDAQLSARSSSAGATFVRAAGIASRRAGSMGAPVTSSMP